MLRALFPLVALGALTMAADADDPPKKDSKWTETVKVEWKSGPRSTRFQPAREVDAYWFRKGEPPSGAFVVALSLKNNTVEQSETKGSRITDKDGKVWLVESCSMGDGERRCIVSPAPAPKKK